MPPPPRYDLWRPNTNANLQLEYAPRPPWHRRRRTRRWLVFGTLGLGLCAALWYRRPIWLQAQIHYWEWRCARHRAPADQVIFSNEPADIAALQKDPAYVSGSNPKRPFILRRAPECWVQWSRLTGQKLGNHPGLGFVHAMRNGRGEPRLVAVTFGTTRQGHIFRRKSIFGMPMRIGGMCLGYAYWTKSDIDLPVRIYAGQIDPGDSSHLILPFDRDGQRGSIDIYLQDDDRLRQEIHLPANAPTNRRAWAGFPKATAYGSGWLPRITLVQGLASVCKGNPRHE